MRFILGLSLFCAVSVLTQPSQDSNNIHFLDGGPFDFDHRSENHRWLGTDGKECYGKKKDTHIRLIDEGKRFRNCLQGMYYGKKSSEAVKHLAVGTQAWYREHPEKLKKEAQFLDAEDKGSQVKRKQDIEVVVVDSDREEDEDDA